MSATKTPHKFSIRILRRNKKIRERYHQLNEIKKLRSDYCLELLEDEFFLSTATLWYIVSRTGWFKNEPLDWEISKN